MADFLIIAFFVVTFLGIGLVSVAMIAAEERRQHPTRRHLATVHPLQEPRDPSTDGDLLAA